MLIYLHGFNSSPQSKKAVQLARHLAQQGLGERFACPALPHEPARAIDAIKAELACVPNQPVTLVGSSLGGFYATWFTETYGMKAVLINPAVHPHRDLRAFLGAQRNLYTGEPYELTEAHLDQWAALTVAQITPSRYLLLVETGDEVLDYREALERYAGAEQIVVQGGDHSFASFADHLPHILKFSGLRADAPEMRA